MKLDFLPLGKLTDSKANMRCGRKAPDVTDLVPSVRVRGVLQSLVVRPQVGTDLFEVLAGRRRWHAALAVAAEQPDAVPDHVALLPCAIIEPGDDAAALEASMLENMVRLDPDEVKQWESFVALVRKGRNIEEIAATFGLPEQAARRVLALGNLLPRIRDLYRREEIDATTVRHLTMASKTKQQEWLALFDDDDQRVPTGPYLRNWLLGGQSIPTKVALFDLADYPGRIITTLFGDDAYFADAEAFWIAQDAAVAARAEALQVAGWADVVIVTPSEHFQSWEYEKTPKRKGGKVYIDVRQSGEVTVHEGYLSRKDARKAERGETGAGAFKPTRPEITSTMQTYVDLHRHSAVRADLLHHPMAALRLMVAHAIGGSHLWRISPDPRTSRNADVTESAEGCPAEAAFDTERRAVLDLLGFSLEEPTVTGGSQDDHGVAGLFLRLLALPDDVVLRFLPVIMGETLVAGSAAIEAVGTTIGTDMANWWSADSAFFELLRDNAVLVQIVAEIAGETIASANAKEKGKTLKRIARAHLDGEDGRAKVERWVPRWMRFAPSAYTDRGGVAAVTARAKVEAARAALAEAEAAIEAEGQAPVEPQRLAA